MNLLNKKIAVIGVGYVGLPLAIEFGKKNLVIAFDTNIERIRTLKKGDDDNHDYDKSTISAIKNITFT